MMAQYFRTSLVLFITLLVSATCIAQPTEETQQADPKANFTVTHEGKSPMYRSRGAEFPPSPKSKEERRDTVSIDTSTKPPAKAMTRLRIVGQPIGEFRQHDYYRVGVRLVLEKITATFKNVGDVEATGVKVTAVTPAGKRVLLGGPTNIPRNTEAAYTASAREVVTTDKKLTASATCSNCRAR